MNHQQMENTIQFLVENQARFQTDLEELKQSQQRTDQQIRALAEHLLETSGQVNTLAETVEAMREEMRQGFENQILANEVTRDLATKIGELAMQTSQRVTKLEERDGERG